MRINAKIRGVAAALCAASVTVPGASAAVKTWPVAVRTLQAPAPAGYHVFRSAGEWMAKLNQAQGPKYTGSVLPNVAWDREMVLAVGLGRRPTSGYAVQITSVARVGREIVVTVRETAPRPDAVTAQVITYPSHTVAVKRMTGPLVFVVNGQRRQAAAAPSQTRPSVDPVRPRGDAASLAKSLFVVRESGGIAGLDRQTIVYLYGRPIRPGEVFSDVRQSRKAETGGPLIRMVEEAVRDSGFMRLDRNYTASRPVADGMTRTIRVQLDGWVKTVTVEDGATAPQAFEETWKAIQTAINSRGTMVPPWERVPVDRNQGAVQE